MFWELTLNKIANINLLKEIKKVDDFKIKISIFDILYIYLF